MSGSWRREPGHRVSGQDAKIAGGPRYEGEGISSNAGAGGLTCAYRFIKARNYVITVVT